MIKTEEIRMFNDPNLVEYRTNLEGWTGPDGLYYGKGDEGERRARYGNSTHRKCGECGDSYVKNSYCRPCSERLSRERFLKLDEIDWDGKSMMVLYNDDRFFSDMDEVYDYCEDNEIDIKELKLMHCEKQVDISEVNIDELNEEYTTEDGRGVSDFHPEIADKVEELNELIRKAEPKLWFQTNKRIKLNNINN
jgi:hypothetical protein